MNIDLDIIYKYAGKNSILNTVCDDKKIDITDIDSKLVTLEDYELLIGALRAYEKKEWESDTFPNEQRERLKYLDQYLDIPALALFYSKPDYKLLSRFISNEYDLISTKVFKSDKILMDFYKYGGIEELKWMLKHMLIEFDCGVTAQFANYGNLKCLRYAREKGCPWDKDTPAFAALNGHLECLRYAYENKCPWDTLTTAYAALGGQLKCLRYAHEKGCPWNAATTFYAAQNGHLNCLRYAYENGCRWDRSTTFCAAENGRLNCLRYAYEYGCPINIEECLKNAHENCKEWLLKLKNQP